MNIGHFIPLDVSDYWPEVHLNKKVGEKQISGILDTGDGWMCLNSRPPM